MLRLSLRLLDVRSLEHSTIMYESDGLKPLLRLSWNKQDANYLATVGLDSNTTTILDIRYGAFRACVRLEARMRRLRDHRSILCLR